MATRHTDPVLSELRAQVERRRADARGVYEAATAESERLRSTWDDARERADLAHQTLAYWDSALRAVGVLEAAARSVDTSSDV